MLVLKPDFLYRLASYPLIEPIGDTHWFTAKAPIRGADSAQPLEPAPALRLGHPDFLAPLVKQLEAEGTYALLVMHRGELVVEHYHRYARDNQSNSKSLMKTVLALLLGIAQAEGRLEVTQAAADFLPEWRGDKRRHITIEHLLTMQSGLRSDLAVPGSYLLPDLLPLYFAADVGRVALGIPAVAAPGAYWEYNNVNSQVLGIVLERATGSPYADYLSEKLWQPLGCSDAQVGLDRRQGTARTFATLFARAQDWLRVGELIRCNGLQGDRQLVPADWIRRMEVPRNADGDYGYHIWLKAHRTRSVRGIPAAQHFMASEDFVDPDTVYLEGMHGQTVCISRHHELVALRIGRKPRHANWDSSHLFNTLLREVIGGTAPSA